MTRSQSQISFHDLTFLDELPTQRDVRSRLEVFLKTTHAAKQRAEIEVGCLTEEHRVYPYNLVTDADRRRIKIRSVKHVQRLRTETIIVFSKRKSFTVRGHGNLLMQSNGKP